MSEQMRMIGSGTADFVTARFLLRPGKGYQQAKTGFQPYKEIKEPYPDARMALARLVGKTSLGRFRKRYIYVNNRLEGCAPWTIAAALEAASAGQ